jgi:hypothetical protein
MYARLAPLAFTLLSLTGCATAKMAHDDIKTYVRHVNDAYNCIGIEIRGRSAICIGDIYLTIQVKY